MLFEGIAHIDSISLDRFIDTVRRMQNKDSSIELSVKVDGSANIGLGLDQEGKIYFDRSVKGQTDRKISPDDWPKKPMFNAIRSGVAALLSKKQELEKLMKPGDYTDAEIMFEAMPNSIEYGKNMIVFHNAKFNNLAKKLGKTKARIDLYFYNFNSKKIKKSNRIIEYEFGGKEVISSDKYELSVNSEITKIENFMKERNQLFGVSNFEVLGMRSQGEDADKIKREKERLEGELRSLKLKIKDKLIDHILNKIPASSFAPQPQFDEKGRNISGSWPEGIVIKDLKTGDLTKVVSIFPDVNKFLWHYREVAMKGTGPAGSFVPGIMTRFKTNVADHAFNIPVLKTPGASSYIDKKYKDKSPNEKLLFFLKDQGFNFKQANRTKNEFVKAVDIAIKSLNDLRKDFEERGKKDVLHIEKGIFKRDVKYGEIQIRKTYETFLDVENELTDYKKEVKKAKATTPEGLAVQLLRIFLGQRNLAKMNESYKLRSVVKSILNESARSKSIGVIVGRFQPPQKAHIKLVKNALKDNDRVYVFVAGQTFDKKKNPIPFNIRSTVLNKFLADRRIQVLPAKTGFIPGLVEDNADLNDVSMVKVYAGTDRIDGYKKQFEDYWDKEGVKFQTIELQRDPDSVSATKVRQSVAANDFSSFSSYMPEKLDNKYLMNLFKQYQKFIPSVKAESIVASKIKMLVEEKYKRFMSSKRSEH